MSDKVVLVVDDDPDILELIEVGLTSKGFKVQTCNDPLQALALAKKLHPQAVVLDIVMPRLSGYEVCRQIKAERKLKDIPVIMLSSKDTVADVEAGFDAGADYYLNKPFKLFDLIRKLNQAVPFNTEYEESWSDILTQKLRRGKNVVPLGKIADVSTGVSLGQKYYLSNTAVTSDYWPMLVSTDISPFAAVFSDHYVLAKAEKHTRFPAKEVYESPQKIIVKVSAPPLIAAVDSSCYLFDNTLYAVLPHQNTSDIHYLTGLLNSKLFTYIWKYVLDIPFVGDNIMSSIRPVELKSLPIKLANKSEEGVIAELSRKLSKPAFERVGADEVNFALELKLNDAVEELYDLTVDERLKLKMLNL